MMLNAVSPQQHNQQSVGSGASSPLMLATSVGSPSSSSSPMAAISTSPSLSSTASSSSSSRSATTNKSATTNLDHEEKQTSASEQEVTVVAKKNESDSKLDVERTSATDGPDPSVTAPTTIVATYSSIDNDQSKQKNHNISNTMTNNTNIKSGNNNHHQHANYQPNHSHNQPRYSQHHRNSNHQYNSHHNNMSYAARSSGHNNQRSHNNNSNHHQNNISQHHHNQNHHQHLQHSHHKSYNQHQQHNTSNETPGPGNNTNVTSDPNAAPIDMSTNSSASTVPNGQQRQNHTSSSGPPHYVDLHVNSGECVSLQLLDGQEQVVTGPATITMISQQQNPPVPIPVQVPPGHMIHQIADENGTLKHIILSVMDSGDEMQLDSTVITLPQGTFRIDSHGELINVDGGDGSTIPLTTLPQQAYFANYDGCSMAAYDQTTMLDSPVNDGSSIEDKKSTNQSRSDFKKKRNNYHIPEHSHHKQHITTPESNSNHLLSQNEETSNQDKSNSSIEPMVASIALEANQIVTPSSDNNYAANHPGSAIIATSEIDLVNGTIPTMLPTVDGQIYGYPAVSCCCCCYCDPQEATTVADQSLTAQSSTNQEVAFSAIDAHHHHGANRLSTSVSSTNLNSGAVVSQAVSYPLNTTNESIHTGASSGPRGSNIHQIGQNGAMSSDNDISRIHKGNRRDNGPTGYKSKLNQAHGASDQRPAYYHGTNQHSIPPSYNNIVAGHTNQFHQNQCYAQDRQGRDTVGSFQYNKHSSTTGQPPLAATNYPQPYASHIHHGSHLNQSHSNALSSSANHKPSSIRSSGGSISPMRARTKAQAHGSHNNNQNNHHLHQQAHNNPTALYRSASSSSNHFGNIDPSLFINGPTSRDSSASAKRSAQHGTPRGGGMLQIAPLSDQSKLRSSSNIDHLNIPSKSGPAWQPGNKFQAQSQVVPQQVIKSQYSKRVSSNDTINQDRRTPSLSKSINQDQQQVDISPQGQSDDNSRASRGKQKKSQTIRLSKQRDQPISADSKSKISDEEEKLVRDSKNPKETKGKDTKRSDRETSQSSSIDHVTPNKSIAGTKSKLGNQSIVRRDTDADHPISDVDNLSHEQKIQPKSQSNTEKSPSTTEKISTDDREKDEILYVTKLDPPAHSDNPTSSKVVSNQEKLIKISMRTSLSENNIQGLEVAGGASCSMKSTQTTPQRNINLTSGTESANFGSKSSLPNMMDDDTLSGKKLRSIENKIRSSKNEPKVKLNSLPQLKILNLNCTSITSGSVQLRWSYMPSMSEKYGINHHHIGTKNPSHLLDHFVVETSNCKNIETNYLVSPKIVYQGCAMTCRVSHLSPEKIYHFRVRRTALVNANTTSIDDEVGGSNQEHLVVSEILSVTLPSAQQSHQTNREQQSSVSKRGKENIMAPSDMIVVGSSGGSSIVANRGNSSSHNSNINHNNTKSGAQTIKLSSLVRHCRSKIVSIIGNIVQNSLSSCSDTKFAGLLIVLFTIFAMLLAKIIHFYFVAPVIE